MYGEILFFFNLLFILFVVGGPFFLFICFINFFTDYKLPIRYLLIVILSLLVHFAISFCLTYFDIVIWHKGLRKDITPVSVLLEFSTYWFLLALVLPAIFIFLYYLFDRRKSILKAIKKFNNSLKE